MEKFKKIIFSDYSGEYEVIVGLTETDSESTFWNFLEEAYERFQDYIVEQTDPSYFRDFIDENGELIDEYGYIKAIEQIKENCHIARILDIPENEAYYYIGTEDYGSIDW